MALAGIFQAAALTQQVARRGVADSDAADTSIRSLFKIDAEDVRDVYGGTSGLRIGLRRLIDQLQGSASRDIELTGYAVALIQLERRLVRRSEMSAAIAAGIEQTAQRLQHFPVTHSNIVAQLADIYKSTVSRLTPRIMVKGEPLHLANPEQANRIRALLLAGIRSAVLWRQCGGRRSQVIFGRRKLVRTANYLLLNPSEKLPQHD